MLPPIVHDRVFYFPTRAEAENAAFNGTQNDLSVFLYPIEDVFNRQELRATIYALLISSRWRIYIYG